MARAIALGSSLLLGTAVAILTARWLGPDGKGFLALLVLLTALFTRLAVMGLGEAIIVFAGQGLISTRPALRATFAGMFVTTSLALIAYLVTAVLVVQPDTGEIWAAVLLGAVLIPLGAIADVFTNLLLQRRQIIRASLVVALVPAVTLALLPVFVGSLDLGIAGAVLASLGGAVAAALWTAHRAALVVPSWDSQYLHRAFRYGSRIELAFLTMAASSRIDLLIVFVILGATYAGVYSIALTIAGIATYLSTSVAFVTFPRLVELSLQDALEVTFLTARLSLILSICVSLPLAASAGWLVPVLFGSEFESAAVPGAILAVSGVFWGIQWILARGVAATARPGLLLESFGLGVCVMVVIDLMVVPSAGILGASLGWTASAMVGLAWCLRAYSRLGIGLAGLRPVSADIPRLARMAKRAIGRPAH